MYLVYILDLYINYDKYGGRDMKFRPILISLKVLYFNAILYLICNVDIFR